MNQYLQNIIDAMPEDQKEEAKLRINWMEVNGWRQIGVWPRYAPTTHNGQDDAVILPYDILDIVGISPDGKLCFISEEGCFMEMVNE